MKLYLFCIVVALGAMNLCSCGSSKKIEKSPIKTFVMPCSELVSGDGVLRAWASGKSDSEMAARKKAQMAAATDLAATLERVVGALIEDKSVIVAETNGISKSLLTEKASLSVKQTLKGAVIVCDQWTKDEITGQYTNYLVLEFRGEDYLKNLYDILGKNGSTSADKKLLEERFYKLIDDSNNE